MCRNSPEILTSSLNTELTAYEYETSRSPEGEKNAERVANFSSMRRRHYLEFGFHTKLGRIGREVGLCLQTTSRAIPGESKTKEFTQGLMTQRK